MKKVIIIAGPNGAGKTTFARNFLPKEAQTYQFINADLIAAGLSPFNPDLAAFKAGRIMLSEIEAVSISGHNFALETTLSGVHYLTQIKRWQNLGYTVKLWFLMVHRQQRKAAHVHGASTPHGPNTMEPGTSIWQQVTVAQSNKTSSLI